jgi:hypothetical protein
MPIKVFIALIQIFAIAFTASAELFDMNRVSVRAMGMGNAYTAVVDNADSLFYNPAGLARIGGVSWTIFEATGGFSNLTELTEAMTAVSGGSIIDIMNSLYGEQVWIGGHGKTAVTLPNMAAALYTTIDYSFGVNNPSLPELSANILTDTGLAAGAGLGIIPGLHVGAVLKSISRVGTRQVYGVTELGTLDYNSIAASFSEGGQGFSIDVGANLIIQSPVTPVISMVARNVGGTTFLTTSDSLPNDDEEIILGGALLFNLPMLTISPSFDLRYIGDKTGLDLGRRLNLGLEVDLPVFDIRAGFHQGYFSYGAGMSLGLIQMDFASYGVEMGQYAGQLEDRRYLLSFKMELGVDLGLGSSGGSSSGGKAGAARGGSGGSSRLAKKQRR